ncbi:MAG TPA: hypothetical protein PLC89_29025 [Haliscomenobacter sp.]|uniref:hypothetical protein n=1 Tax=Haliscomenobacter sp. TaxID=2717303 RepID=UPI002C14653C|nr:hypothetical protein [Haliscomenobacter sp.]HOY21392.1 hypothetical protein [Haliscomenobacter sp.]HPH19190.1 hypothetical protein [Haliscomenobacter sp.]
MSKKLIIIGGDGKGAFISSVVEDNRRNFGDLEFEIAGYCNDYDIGKTIHGYPVLGRIADIPRFIKEGYFFAFAIHMTNRNYLTEAVFLRCNLPNDRLPNIISKRAFLAPTVELAPGACVMQFASISQNAKIGQCTILAPHALVGHDTMIGPLCHISSTSVVGSRINIGKVVTIGLHATVIEFCNIGDYALVGAASLVLKDIPSGQIWVGHPAKYFREVSRD